ncbi:MAG TPA: undecaprenyldiphospho-muramoylpentapeptide beta-N-acetylglucosaminyltransferase [Polyangia bacterium]|nr:undecaprenyldiphospho-muramoylpentapeptide beta-N-acetylglucosaminyltransferase [Polyangia bacterium]
MTGRPLRLVIAGGGTGGHVIPALAIAEEVVRRGGSVRFIGTADRIEARLVPAAGFGIDFIAARPLAGGGALGTLRGVLSATGAVARSARLLGRIAPDVVLGVGGYVAGPVVLAGRIRGLPIAVLEQNATVGLANRLLARIVDRAFVTYEPTVCDFPDGRAVVTGNPVRSTIVEAARGTRAGKAGEHLGLLVMGGSQGARTIDRRVPEALQLTGLGDRLRVLHQCGLDRISEVERAYADRGIAAAVVPFIDDIATALAAADLVIARAGATTVAELTVMGLPAVLLPYPHHADRQQERNAAPMREAGAALVLDEKTTDVAQLAEAIGGLLGDPDRLARAAAAARGLGRPDAAERIVDGLQALARRSR